MNCLFDIYERKNVVLLEGNHDIYPWYYASDDKNNENKNFMNKTLPQMIEGLNEKEINEFKKKLRRFYRRLKQVYMFTYDNQKYIVTHGGLSLVPDHLVKISSKQLISGVGEHEDEIGKIFMEHSEENLCKGFIQIHGHRWSPSNKYSYCLEDSVEFGGNLVFLQLVKGKEPEIIKIKNNTYNKEVFYEDCGRNYIVDDKRIERMLNSYNIKVKEQPEHDLLSINFTHRAFRKGLWNTNTIKARGLFVNKNTGEVKLRSYNKFFNYEELESKGEENPFKFMKQPLRVSKKENGFLGILSVVDDEFVLASKSQIYGEMKDYFQEVFDLVAKRYKNELFKILKENNLSVVFEVIHPKDNQHPIDYNNNYKLYLLDFLKNQIDFGEAKNPKACVDWEISEKYKNMFMENTRFLKEKTESVLSFSKDVYVYINNFEELKEVVSRYFGDNVEGAVITDREGFMFKYKTDYYNSLKYRRMLLSQIKPEPELFEFWIKMVEKQDKIFYNKIRKYKHSDLFNKTIREVNKLIEKDE